MKNKKLIAAFLSVSMLLALGGCNKSEVKETDAEEEEETTEQVTEETETTEISKETEKTEETEDTEPEESTEGTYYGNYAGDESEFSKIYTELRNYATELNESNGGLLYGFGSNTVSETTYDLIWEYVLLTYDGNQLTAYHDIDGKIEPVELQEYGYLAGEWEPKKFLFEYEDFMEYPFLDDFSNFVDEYFHSEVDPRNIDAVLDDGGYGGWLRGFSGDMKYAYCQFGPESTIDKSMEECLNLKEGDKVKVDGEEFEVSAVEFQEEEGVFLSGCYVISLGEIDYGGYFVGISVDDNGNAENMSIFDCFGNPTYSYHRLSKVPIAEDAEINVSVYLNGGYADESTITGSELHDYLSDWIDVCPTLTKFEDGGVKINGSTEIGYGINEDHMVDSVRIENGEIVHMTFMIWNW